LSIFFSSSLMFLLVEAGILFPVIFDLEMFLF